MTCCRWLRVLALEMEREVGLELVLTEPELELELEQQKLAHPMWEQRRQKHHHPSERFVLDVCRYEKGFEEANSVLLLHTGLSSLHYQCGGWWRGKKGVAV